MTDFGCFFMWDESDLRKYNIFLEISRFTNLRISKDENQLN